VNTNVAMLLPVTIFVSCMSDNSLLPFQVMKVKDIIVELYHDATAKELHH
jgi:hypothetical protein